MSAGAPAPSRRCAACGTELPEGFLACPSCGRLVHADALKALAAEADAADQAGDKSAALAKWRQALGLLPPSSTQHARVSERVHKLSLEVDTKKGDVDVESAPDAEPAAPAAERRAQRRRGPIYSALAAIGAALVKFKFAVLFLLAKGKLLLAGLLQAKTFLSMAIAVGVYAMAFGWRFAVGLIASIYVHEMGHVERLRHYGIPATAPMFIPGFGAFVRLNQRPATPREDARVGLAGPLWGLGAALVFLAVGHFAELKTCVAIARIGAWINLFNLTPVWQLDGGRAFNALSRTQRGMIAGLLWVLSLLRIDGMLFLLAIGATWRASRPDAPEEGDNGAFLEYTAIALALVAIVVVAK